MPLEVTNRVSAARLRPAPPPNAWIVSAAEGEARCTLLCLQERAPGLRGGGYVRVALETVPVHALCEEVPRSLPVDISRLEMGGTVQVQELEWPDTINLLLAGRPQQTLVKIIDRLR